MRRIITAFLLAQMNNGAFCSRVRAQAFFVDVSDQLNTERHLRRQADRPRGARHQQARGVHHHPHQWDNESDENVIESVTLTYDFFELVQ